MTSGATAGMLRAEPTLRMGEMEAQINLTADQLRALEIIARGEKRSIDELVQQAVAAYLDARREGKRKGVAAGFGAWGPGEDGLAYQERLRSEW